MGACGQAGAPTPRKAQVMNMKRGGPLHVNGGSEISLSVTGVLGDVSDGSESVVTVVGSLHLSGVNGRGRLTFALVTSQRKPVHPAVTASRLPAFLQLWKTPNRGNRGDRTGDTSQRPGGPGADA